MKEVFIYTGQQLLWELHKSYLMFAEDDTPWRDYLADCGYENIESSKLYVVNEELAILRKAEIEDLTFKDILNAFESAAPYWRDQWFMELRKRFGNQEVEQDERD